jgi:hypothetical protein
VALRCSPTPLSIETDVAPEIFQESVARLYGLTVVGDTVKEVINGRFWLGGGVVPVTVTVAVAITPPKPFVAVRVYVVVTDGETDTEPLARAVCVPTPLSIETEVAPEIFQDNVAGLP